MARVALITGGTRGIGAAITKALKAAGYKVAANYGGNDEAAQKFKAETSVPVFKWDVSSYDACAEGIKKVEGEVGPVEVLVNNAGITRDAMFHRMKPEQWTAVINTNLGSLFNMCRPLIEGMRDRKFGRIINISSINGQKGQMGQTNYSAAKAGELGFTKALAQEGARSGITVNAICPGYINTEMVQAVPKDVLEKSILPQIPIGRLGEPEEIARCVGNISSSPGRRIHEEGSHRDRRCLLVHASSGDTCCRTGRRRALQRCLRQSRLRVCRTERWANHSPAEWGQARRAEATADGGP
jgi:acetoacetyl-CoA reductase